MSEEVLFLKMTPRDLLFCRDARPMESSWTGKGGFLPGPATFLGALTTEFCRKFPEELKLRYAQRKGNGLRSRGPFLCKEGELYFPVPLDIAPENKLLELGKLEGESDFPGFLEYALFAPQADKRSVAPYISMSELKNYLESRPFKTVGEREFFDREARPGITITPDTRTAEDGAFYYAEYLRLKPGVSLVGEAALNGENCLSRLFEGKERPLMPLGGQQTMVYVEAQQGKRLPWPQVRTSGTLVKWVLLTPAAFTGGWLPDFVEPETGRLLLTAETGERPERLPGENRAAYRKRIVKIPIAAKLIAARVGKSIPVSGWKQKGEGGGAPRAAHLCVPAGSIYYFRADDEKNAEMLVKTLTGKAYSVTSGRAGFGIGICGNFKISD